MIVAAVSSSSSSSTTTTTTVAATAAAFISTNVAGVLACRRMPKIVHGGRQ